ncbi:uncharacterized protein LOC106638493 [Copidosoma floridanum]|uniref:uncharacterized protein LOC106638493 n=1 Tax=Copidosoma floridanum TaxID=29053 RepID=UPI0006C96380|nr:uncharacterized protein LOC106638493 [Copidosoma floridanum]
MKLPIVLAVVFAVVAVYAADTKNEEYGPEKLFRRIIPADVLRDFPNMCFASTKCKTININETWDLTPFCGLSRCVEGPDGRLMEVVDDCGPLPKPNPKCNLSLKTNKTAPFPGCCPIFECEGGAKLEYPEISTVPPESPEEPEVVKAAAKA